MSAPFLIGENMTGRYAFCVIEHDTDFIARLCDPMICMTEGKVLALSTVEQVKNGERVIEAFPGRGLKNRAMAKQ
jgi:branched-chain amino acid transport system ATP-binding protein